MATCDPKSRLKSNGALCPTPFVVLAPGADVPFLLKSADLFFFPSLWEGLPGAVLEALAAGLSVAGSDIQPMQEIAPHFPQRAFLAGANATDAHVQHILHALAAAPPLAYPLARAQFLATPFAMPQAIQRFADLYGLT
jgi:glycosyltransferase involved in cell wall biosynthesis